MSIRSNHPIKEAIKAAFVKTGMKYLDYGDFKFILLDLELKRYPTLAKKKLYQDWERKFKHEKIHWVKHPKYHRQYEWDYPFKRFNFDPSFIAEALGDMKKDGIIVKTEDRGYRLSIDYLKDGIQTIDVETIIENDINGIIQSRMVRLYGFDLVKIKLENDNIKEFKKIVDKFEDAIAMLFELQYRIATKTFFDEIDKLIKTEKISEKDFLSIYSLYSGLFGEFEFGKDGSITHSLDKKELSKLEFVGDIQDLFYEYMKEKNKELSNIEKIFIESISHSNKCIVLHPLKFTQFEKILDPNLTNSEKLLDHVESDVFLEYLGILQELQLGEMELVKKIRKYCHINMDKWEKILPDMKLVLNMRDTKRL